MYMYVLCTIYIYILYSDTPKNKLCSFIRICTLLDGPTIQLLCRAPSCSVATVIIIIFISLLIENVRNRFVASFVYETFIIYVRLAAKTWKWTRDKLKWICRQLKNSHSKLDFIFQILSNIYYYHILRGCWTRACQS